jgi:hypothetical protein
MGIYSHDRLLKEHATTNEIREAAVLRLRNFGFTIKKEEFV